MAGVPNQRDAMPDVLRLMTHDAVRRARGEGRHAILAATPDLERILWVSEPAAAMLAIVPGPQPQEPSGAVAEAARRIMAAPTDADGAGRRVSFRNAEHQFALSQERLAPGDRPFALLAAWPMEPVDPSREGLRLLAEIGRAPIAVWHATGSWFDGGFQDVWQVFAEDLQDLRDADTVSADAFLADGRPIGLARLSRSAVAVWHLGGARIGELAFAAPSSESAEAGAQGAGSLPAPMVDPQDADGVQADEAADGRTHGGTAEAERAERIGPDADPVVPTPEGLSPQADADDYLHQIRALEEPVGDMPASEEAEPADRDHGHGDGIARTARVALRSLWSAPQAGDSANEPAASDTASGAATGDGAAAPAAPDMVAEDMADLPDAFKRSVAPGAPGDRIHRTPPEGVETSAASGTPDAPETRDPGDGSDHIPASSPPSPRAPLRSNWGATRDVARDDADGAEPDAPSGPVIAESDPSQEDLGRAMPALPTAGEASASSDADSEDPSEPAERVEDEASDEVIAGLTQAHAPHEPIVGPAPSGARPARREDFGRSASGADAPADAFTPVFDGPPVRFVWRIDHDGRFHSLSPELAGAVGQRASDVVGLSFDRVARAFDLDPDGEIAGLLAGRDTWSGRTVAWPVENSDSRIPVDLAALPVYARDRSFDGFRGFGVARPGEPVPDPRAIGLRLAGGESVEALADEASEPPAEAPDMEDGRAPVFGRRPPEARPADPAADAAPVSASAASAETVPVSGEADQAAPSVIQLAERRRQREAPLSAEESDAFRVIGEALSRGGEHHGGLEEAIRTARDRIAEFDRTAGPSAAGRGEDDAQEAQPIALVPALQAAYDALPIPILVQAGETLVYANAEFRDLTGYKDAGELMGRGGLDHLFAENAEGETVRLRRAGGGTLDLRAQMQRVTLAGRACLVLCFFASPRLAYETIGAGEPARLLPGESEALADRVAALNAAIAEASEAFVLIDAERRIDVMNDRAAQLFGLSAVDENGCNDARGRAFTSLFAHESQRAVVALMDGEAGPIEDGRTFIGRRADGLFISLSLLVEPLGEGGWCAIMRPEEAAIPPRDETEALRRAEEAALRQTEFLAGVATEIRTPMNAILGFADAIASEAFGPLGSKRYRDYVNDIKRSGRHVLDLVDDLLELSKAEAGKLDLDFSALALNEVAGEVISTLQPLAGSARVVLRSNLPSSVPPVVADERSVRQILTHVVRNAIATTPAGGQVIVSSQQRADGSVVIRCRDTGVGMTEAEIEQALTPYNRLKPDGDRPLVGSGLGLPLARTMAQANRADMTITSQPQAGTLVELIFAKDRVLVD